MIKNPIIILFLCVALAFILRSYKLGEISLYGDELTMVEDSYSLLKTSKDQLGNSWPLTFKMGEGRQAGYVYTSIPFVALFGPTEWGVRSLSVLSGLGIVILMFFLGKKLFDEKIGLMAAFLAAVSPWDLSLSRGGFEAHFALFLALLGTSLLLYASRRPSFYILSAIAFGLTLITYPTYKLVLPVFLTFLFVTVSNLRKIFDRPLRIHVVGGILIFIFFLSISFSQTLLNKSESRFFNIYLFADRGLRENLVQDINYERSISSLPKEINQFFYNKPLKYTIVLLKGYLDNFSIDFLFLTGDGNPRHNMTAMGYFYWVEILFILLGIFNVFSIHRKIFILLIGWILVAPIATSLILVPHGLRNAFMMPPLMLLSAVGLNQFIDGIKHRWFVLAFAVLLFGIWSMQILMVLTNLYYLSPQKFAKYWSYSAKQAAVEINNRKADYDFIFLSSRIDNAEYAYQVYNRIDPRVVIEQSGFPVEINGLKFKKYENVYIGTIPTEDYEKFFVGLEEKDILYLANYDERDGLTDYEIYNTPDLLTGFIIKTY